MFHCDRYSLFPAAYSLPILALEVVSRNYRKEYTDKLDEYADLGLLYYVI
jgi:Uma2 family endonuclease